MKSPNFWLWCLQSPINGNPLDLVSFHPYREDIRRELAFKDDIVRKAELFLENIRSENHPNVVTFVSIHVRGHDYKWVLTIMYNIIAFVKDNDHMRVLLQWLVGIPKTRG